MKRPFRVIYFVFWWRSLYFFYRTLFVSYLHEFFCSLDCHHLHRIMIAKTGKRTFFSFILEEYELLWCHELCDVEFTWHACNTERSESIFPSRYDEMLVRSIVSPGFSLHSCMCLLREHSIHWKQDDISMFYSFCQLFDAYFTQSLHSSVSSFKGETAEDL